MRSKPKDVGPRKEPKRLGPLVDAKLPYDKQRGKVSTKRASEAADKLLREMDEVLKHLDRKG